ncbi:MAG: ECF-type sigma factor [Planctomycetota bacterium]
MPDLTRTLQSIRNAEDPPDELEVEVLYDEVRRLARSLMRAERRNHTLPPTAVANEAWVRLFRSRSSDFTDSSAFFAAAANTLRHVLVDHGRRRARQKRGGDRERSEVDFAAIPAPERDHAVLVVDAALERLAAFDPGKARLVELRFFAGLTVAEAAHILGVSERTAARDWRVASAFLRAELQEHARDQLDG